MKSDAEKWMSSDNLDTAFSLMETLEYLSDFTVKNKKREKAQKIEDEAFINARNEYLKKEFWSSEKLICLQNEKVDTLNQNLLRNLKTHVICLDLIKRIQTVVQNRE